MLKLLPSLLLLASCTGSYNYASLGVGQLSAHNWKCSQSASSRVQIGKVYEIEDNHQIDLNVAHSSQPNCGNPVNKRPESSTEWIGVHYRYIWKDGN